MRAAVYDRYGPPEVARVAEIANPEIGEGDVLVRVHAASVTTADWRARSLQLPKGFGWLGRPMFGFRGPRNQVLGTTYAGVVEAVGAQVRTFRPGTAVLGMTGLAMGSHGEFIAVSADSSIIAKPDALSFAEAAALPFGGTTALHFLRDKGQVQAGESVLINGASGSVGSAAVQIARHLGAEVTAVCSGANAELVAGLGAQHVIDYTKADLTTAGRRWDVIMDTVGTAPFNRVRDVLEPGGRFLCVLGSARDMLLAPWVSATTPFKMYSGPASEERELLEALAGMAETGALRPLVDGIWPLDDVVEAHRRVDSRRKRGEVILAIGGETLAQAREGKQ